MTSNRGSGALEQAVEELGTGTVECTTGIEQLVCVCVSVPVDAVSP